MGLTSGGGSNLTPAPSPLQAVLGNLGCLRTHGWKCSRCSFLPASLLPLWRERSSLRVAALKRLHPDFITHYKPRKLKEKGKILTWIHLSPQHKTGTLENVCLVKLNFCTEEAASNPLLVGCLWDIFVFVHVSALIFAK